ncbi:MAG: hypothetical protein RLZ98_551 [Pseudomonadota bacterium]
MAEALDACTRMGTALLTDSDHAYLRQHRDPARRRAAGATRAALRLALSHHLGPYAGRQPIAQGAHGKPLLPAGIGAFSISHTERTALVAVAPEGSIGVDVEASRELSFSVARRQSICAAAAASGQSSDLDGDEYLLQSWTRLEAVAKARGSGIGRLLADLGIWGEGQVRGDDAAVEKAARDLLQQEGISVHDLDLPPELYGALAVQPARPGCTFAVQRVSASHLLPALRDQS